MAGGYIIQKIREDLTYDYLHSSEENLWSILYSTGYLTQVRGEELPPDTAALRIPNAEIWQIFEMTVQEWFDDSARKENRTALFEAKYAKTLDGLEASCEAALRQIEDRQYAKAFTDDYDDILCYGIAFYRKRCLVKKNYENCG